MGDVVYLSGPETREAVRNASGPMRQPGRIPRHPESQFVRVGTVVANVTTRALARAEALMNESAVTACRTKP